MLKYDWENCVVERGDSRKHLPWNIGQFGSNTSFTMARTNYVAAMDALQKIKEIAAKDLGGKPDDYDIDGTRYSRRAHPGRGMTYAKAAQRAIELGGKYSGKELPTDINPMTKASATALAGIRAHRRREGQRCRWRRDGGVRRARSSKSSWTSRPVDIASSTA